MAPKMYGEELFEAILTKIKSEPESHDQSVYLRKAECGTAGCVAGWAVLLAYPDAKPLWDSAGATARVFVPGMGERPVEVTAEDLLLLDFDQSDWLFNPNNTIEDIERIGAEIYGGER
jgi:hypothetical protein